MGADDAAAAAGVDAALLRSLGVRRPVVTTEGPGVLLAGGLRCPQWGVAALHAPLLRTPLSPPQLLQPFPPQLLQPFPPQSQPSQLQPPPSQPPAAPSQPPAAPAVDAPRPAAAPQQVRPKKPGPSQLFRLRQKGLISELEQKLARKLSEVQLLSDQNEGLRCRAGVLRAAVEGRDDQIEILGSAPAAAPPSPTAAPPSAPCPAEAAAGAGPPAAPAPRSVRWWERADGTVSRGELEATTQSDLALLLRDFTAACRRGLAALGEEEEGEGEEVGCPMEEGTPDGDPEGAPPTSGAGDDAGRPAGAEQPPPRRSFLLYGSALPRAAAACPARRALFDLVNSRLGAVKHLHLLRPGVVVPLLGVHLETGAPARGPAFGRGFWARAAAALGLSEGQRAGIAAMWELHARQMAGILEERAALQAELAGSPPPQAAHQEGALPQFGGGGALDAAAAGPMEAAEELRRNLHKEEARPLFCFRHPFFAARALLYHFLFGSALSFVQLARLAVASYPLVADAYAIAEVVSLEAAGPRAAAAAAPPPPPVEPPPAALCLPEGPEPPAARAAGAAARAQRA
ncbi:hypothetical protein Rsub_02155 [Raphidocelis subcapitata]|uniref:Uncharacterized protein n=1 Tax=Raphidocelis subcapitata TaxID=307507 RepID=A0A2V0NNV5_9CHLO|nr:hypothetical protein Rsub_02155 [Raphidocelis subcapitata]|eukprot:GBF89278.1 hypothetical protein Rsub_02155 [Raphidocelis subcapitata]